MWPWRRETYAEMTRRLLDLGATEVFFDIDFSSPSNPESDTAFAAALAASHGAVILSGFRSGNEIGSAPQEPTLTLPLLEFQEHAWLASVNVIADADGLVRRYPWGQIVDGGEMELAAAVIAGAFGPAGVEFPINFALRPETVPAYSAIDLVEGRVGADAINGRSVIVGTHAVEVRDQFVVPVHGVISGAVLHALAAETLLQGILPITASPLLLFLLVVPLALGLAVSPLRQRPGALLITYATISLAVEAAAFGLQSRSAIVLPTSLVHATLLGCSLAMAVRELDVRRWLLHFARIESQNRRNVLERIIADSNDAIVIVDQFGAVIEVSASASQLFAIPKVPFAPATLATALPPELSGAVREAIAAFQAGAPLPEGPREAKLVHPGRTLLLEYTITLSQIERRRSAHPRAAR